jgi:hypothetical protein
MAKPWKSSTAFNHASVVLSSKVVAGLFLSPEARQPTDDPEQPTAPALAVLVEAGHLIVAGHYLKGRRLAFPSSLDQPLVLQVEPHRLAPAEDSARQEHFPEPQTQQEASARAFRS